MKLKFGWWNTSLSPVGRASPDDAGHAPARREAASVIAHLFSEHSLDALGLCEVCADDGVAIQEHLGPAFDVRCFNAPWGRATRGDLGVIGRRATVTLNDFAYESYRIEGRTLRVAVTLTLEAGGHAFFFVLSHWPSRARLPRNAPDRHTLGAALRSIFKRLKEDAGDGLVVLAGDYNDEPFDDSLAHQLVATRDASRLSNTQFVTYNPFWRRLGTHESFVFHPPGHRVAGTYRYAGGRETTWHTFDQMIFDREFIHGEAWRIDEAGTGIVTDDIVLSLVRDPRSRIDHLPIIGTVEAK